MITPSEQANRKKTEEKISQPSIKTIPSATTYMQQIKILFSTGELSIKLKPLNCYGASRLRGLRGISPPPPLRAPNVIRNAKALRIYGRYTRPIKYLTIF